MGVAHAVRSVYCEAGSSTACQNAGRLGVASEVQRNVDHRLSNNTHHARSKEVAPCCESLTARGSCGVAPNRCCWVNCHKRAGPTPSAAGVPARVAQQIQLARRILIVVQAPKQTLPLQWQTSKHRTLTHHMHCTHTTARHSTHCTLPHHIHPVVHKSSDEFRVPHLEEHVGITLSCVVVTHG